MLNFIHKLSSKLQNISYQYKYRKFIKIKKITNGWLLPETYKAIYDCALTAQEGVMLDIGPAQGGSSISLGLGIRDSGKSKLSKVFSIEKGTGSSALQSRNDENLNTITLRRNIDKYGLSDRTVVLIGDVKDVHKQVDETQPISLMFIDADGALDRDFKLFYNRLLPGAPIILDDYVDSINKRAREVYLKWSSQSELDTYVKQKGLEKFLDLYPLGKEYTVYRFVNYFLDKGLLKKDKVIGGTFTFFGHKPQNAVFDPEIHGRELLTIRQEILNRYYEINPAIKQG